MTSPLDNLLKIGKLKAEPAAQAEFDGLVRSGSVRLADAQNTTLSLESRFDLACNAAPPCPWRRCGSGATAPRIATWSFRRCSTRCSCRTRSGASSTRPISRGTSASTRESSISTRRWSRR